MRDAEARALAAAKERHSAETHTVEVEAYAEEFRDEVRHLVSARLPALALNLISSHHPVPGLLHESLAGSHDALLLDSVLEHVSVSLLKERRRVDAAARAALRGTNQDAQALSYRLQTEIDELQHEFSAPQSLTSRLLQADHLNEQLLRLLQKSAVAYGAWPGHVRKDTYVTEIIGGASSRLRGFERIQIISRLRSSDIGVVGRAAEPIAMACAELMANALEHSRDDLMVEVSVLQTGNGNVCITFDDSGTGMTAEATIRGTRLLSGDQQEVMLTDLGDPPSQGFAAVGQLVADYGFAVSINHQSAYGGVRAVLSIPPNLLTSMNEEAKPPSAMAPLPASAPQVRKRPTTASTAQPAAPEPTRSPAAAADAGAAPELPQRNRRTLAVSAIEDAAPRYKPQDPRRAQDTWNDFQEGLASGRVNTDSEETP
ncbi:ATP-binding protein [Streptomyces sp. HB132]|uniref:ATP-binding protein n=1 Tax=Streptomyces sp. HB132 TaxID=767388 RepID=UPI00195F669C|nr:ATP-binding protein [Streptomyces sp. HB132]MBM7442692.1 hypothetical protein [Streptomyces sp. HB132]